MPPSIGYCAGNVKTSNHVYYVALALNKYAGVAKVEQTHEPKVQTS